MRKIKMGICVMLLLALVMGMSTVSLAQEAGDTAATTEAVDTTEAGEAVQGGNAGGLGNVNWWLAGGSLALSAGAMLIMVTFGKRRERKDKFR